jgi:hypothetical protein
MKPAFALLAVLLAGCGQVQGPLIPEPAPDPAPAAPQEAAAPDTSEPAGDPAPAADAGPADLGTTVASLGAAGEPGLWLKTPLVDAPARGRVRYPAQGTEVEVELIPLDAAPGAGSRLSLEAMQALGADLTALPEVQVSRL